MQLSRELAVLALACAAGCASTRQNAHAPDTLSFSLPDLSGKTVGTSDYQGRVVLVDFWATWCKPCEHSFPFYSELQTKFGQEGLTVLAISVDERDDDVASFLERHEVSFQVLRDPKGSVAHSIDRAIESMPTAVLLGRDGHVRLVHTGFVSGDEERLTEAVKDALAQPSPQPTEPGGAHTSTETP